MFTNTKRQKWKTSKEIAGQNKQTCNEGYRAICMKEKLYQNN